jgi:antitoxin ParD1/3/4
MNVSLTPALEKFVDGKVESGLYNNGSDEVIREGLRLLKGHDEIRRPTNASSRTRTTEGLKALGSGLWAFESPKPKAESPKPLSKSPAAARWESGSSCAEREHAASP